MKKEIDKLIRDITKAGFMPKSKARERIENLLSKAREEERGRIKEILEKELNYRIERADNGYKNSLELMSSGSATTHWCNSKELKNLKIVLTDAIKERERYDSKKNKSITKKTRRRNCLSWSNF